MAEVNVRCTRNDGKRWQCSRPSMEGKAFCEAHYLQIRQRQLKKPVPDTIKLQPRPKRSKLLPKPEEEEEEDDDSTDFDDDYLPQRRGNNKRKRSSNNDASFSSSSSKKRTNNKKHKSSSIAPPPPDADDANRTPVVKHLKYGVMEIGGQAVSSGSKRDVSPPKKLKVGVPMSTSGFRRPIRSKNAEPIPIATVQRLPSIKANIKATTKKTNNKRKCHWCKWTSYRLFVQCVTCKQFFCEECIDQRFYDKAAVKRECPICEGTCYCRPCIKERLKEDKSKELVVSDPEEELLVSDPEEELVVSDPDEDLVVSDPEDELIVSDPEEDLVVSDPEDELIVSDPEDELVVSDAEEKLVVCDSEEELAVSDPDEDLVVYNPEQEVVVYNRENKFEKIQQLHMIQQLLPVIEKMNQEKIMAFNSEPKSEGTTLSQIQEEGCSQKHQCRNCSFCDAWIADLHRSCISCPYTLCMLCCQEFYDGYLHSGLGDLKNTKVVRSKRPRNKKISWRFCADGSIICPPKKLGGCGNDFLKLDCFSSFNWTKDLEASAKQIVFKYRFKKPFDVASSPCFLCEEKDETGSEKVGNLNKNIGLYFSTKQDFKDRNLEHFMKHWGEGQPVIIRDVLRSQQPDLSWDFGFVLCRYLERSAEARNHGTGTVNSRSRSDWCEVKFGREQTFAGGKTYENVWQEFLNFKLWFNSGFFQEHFRDHYDAVMQALPVEEYLNPLTGYLNLAANSRTENRNPNLGPCVHVSYGGPEDFMGSRHLTKLRWIPHDMMNILAHATTRPFSEAKLNDVKILMKKYSSENHLTSSSKIRKRNKLEEIFESSSDDSSTDEDSDDEDFSEDEIGICSPYGEEQDTDTCGAQWDIFRREDVPKLLDYLRKYSDKLTKPHGSPDKVVHPLFDEVYYLDDRDKTRLKEEFDVEPWSFEQRIGEAVIIPAGCPYQMKKIKSCVNVVLEFISPESANECIKVGDEIRQLPVNHRAKGKRMEVKKMVIDGMHAAIEEMRTVLQTGFIKAEE